MALSPKLLQIAINALAQKLLESESPIIRAKAAKSLGQLGSEEAILPLCEALDKEDNLHVVEQVMDAIILIHNLANTVSSDRQDMEENDRQ